MKTCCELPPNFYRNQPMPSPLDLPRPAAKATDHYPPTEKAKSRETRKAHFANSSTPIEVPGLNAYEATTARKVLVELAKRRIEGLRLYEPMPVQQAFHQSKSREKIILGSNRSGKTLTNMVGIARAVTGQDPFHQTPKENGICYVVGKDGREVGQVLWRKLGRAGAFKIIRDLETKEWRTFRPNDPADMARKDEIKPAPPLIPPRFIREISWENKKENLPKIVYLTTGWEIHFFTSQGLPPQGADIDMAAFDEEIIQSSWYAEISARLVDRNGLFIWSATPQAATIQLFDLHERAEKEMLLNPTNPAIEEFHITIDENEYLTRQQKDDFAAKLSEEEYHVRYKGQFALTHLNVFPEYSKVLHGVDYFQIPVEWTRYLAIDPGRQVCAVLFMAIPPEDHGDYGYIYDELYIQNCDAELFGERMEVKCQGQQFQAFIIDGQEARKGDTGSGRTIEEQYCEALRKRKIASVATGSGFEWGGSDVRSGIEAIRLWLRVREDGTAKLRVMQSRVPNFVDEIKHYRYKRIAIKGQRSIVTDKPEDRGRVHQMANLRYLIQSYPMYVAPKGGIAKKSPIIELLKKRRDKDRENRPLVMLGPGS
jgi:hypothetical protein